jgi:hypothetical protein
MMKHLISLLAALATAAASGRSASVLTSFNAHLLLSPQTESAGKTASAPAEIYGKIRSVSGSRVTVQTRKGDVVEIDATGAIQAQRSVPLVVGHAIDARGSYDAKRVLQAQIILRAKDSPASWSADR